MNKKIIQQSLTRQIDKLIKSPKLKDLKPDQIEQIARSVYIDNLKKEFEHELKKQRINLSDLKNDWLGLYISKETKRVYEKNINIFINWLQKRKNNSILDVKSKAADQYISFINNQKISANSKRLRISACSSFFRQLVRWQVVDLNPFRDLRSLPKKEIEIKRIGDVPAKKDLDFLQQAALWGIKAQGKGSVNRQKGSKKALLAIQILRYTGLRIGALAHLKIDKNNYFQTRSKGRLIHGTLSTSIVKLINKLGFDPQRPLYGYNRNTFAMWMIRTAKRYSLKNYGAHSFRHKWAITYYKKHKDIVSLQKALGHKSLSATQAYLASLENHLAK